MDQSEFKSAVLTKINYMVGNGKIAAAREFVEIFKVTNKASHDDLALYGKLLSLTRQYKNAEKILRVAYKKKASPEVAKDLEAVYWLGRTDKQFREMRAGVALDWCIKLEEVKTVLDVGSGGGEHTVAFAATGRRVDAVDLGRSVYFERSAPEDRFSEESNVNFIKADFMTIEVGAKYDLVWCSHVLEHQPNPNAFLQRCLQFVDDGKWLAITVPPLKHSIVGGHVSLWNAGLLLYQLVLAGNDCSDAIVMTYNYNISVIVSKRPISLPQLDYDAGDIDRLQSFFPPGCSEGFNGRMLGGTASILSNI